MTSESMIQLAIAIPTAGLFLAACFRGVVRMGLIYKEMTPNGGKSLKDRVVNLEATQHDQTERLKRIEHLITNKRGCKNCESVNIQ